MKHADVARTRASVLLKPATRPPSSATPTTAIRSSGRRGTYRWASPASHRGSAPSVASDAASFAAPPM